jgi:hypothetical protein
MCWLLLIPSSGFSWGSEGQRIVAKIAAKNLSPAGPEKVDAILGTKHAGREAAMATAAIGLGNKKAKSRPTWAHFADVPIADQFSIGYLV